MTYNILQYVGAFGPGQSVADTDFPAGTDFDRLVRLRAIEPVPGQPVPDPPKVADLKRQLYAVQQELKVANAKLAEFEAIAAAAS